MWIRAAAGGGATALYQSEVGPPTVPDGVAVAGGTPALQAGAVRGAGCRRDAGATDPSRPERGLTDFSVCRRGTAAGGLLLGRRRPDPVAQQVRLALLDELAAPQDRALTFIGVSQFGLLTQVVLLA